MFVVADQAPVQYQDPVGLLDSPPFRLRNELQLPGESQQASRHQLPPGLRSSRAMRCSLVWTPGLPGAVRGSGAGGEDEVAVDAVQAIRFGVRRQGVAEVVGADLADPLVVLVLVVDERGQQVGGDDRHLAGGADLSCRDGSDAGVDAFGDRFAERGQAAHGGQRTAELLGQDGVHQRVQRRVRAGFGCGQIADHEVGDVGLVTEVPADGAGVLVRSPDHLVRSEVLPQLVGEGGPGRIRAAVL